MGAALVAALLNAVFAFCLGCEVYLLDPPLHRLTACIQHHPRLFTTTRSTPTMSRENSLVTAQWVEDNLDTDGIVLIEVDEDTTAYDKGHIQGAIKLDWTTDLQDQVRRDFVNKEQFEALLSERGVANDDTVVLYGGNNNWFAAYAYWYFKLYGHQDVKLLDGGRKKWELDSRELTDDLPVRAPRRRTPRPSRTPRSAPSATRPSPRSARRTSSTCAAPTSTPAGCSPRPTSRRSRRSAPATSRPSLNVPWSKNCQRRRHLQVRRRAQGALRRGRLRRVQGHHRATAASASARRSRGSCSRSCSARRT